MYCNKCGIKNNDTNKFCINCGNNIERKINYNKVKEKLAKSELSLIAMYLFIANFLSYLLMGFTDLFDFLASIPWIPVSLILSIISKCKYNDKLSLVMIILNCVVIGLSIIIVILVFVFFFSLFEMLINGFSGGTTI